MATDEKDGKSREARVMGLLKDMEESIVKEETQAYRLLHNLEDKLRNIVSNVDIVGSNKVDNVESQSKVRVWKAENRDPKRPWTEADKNRKILTIHEVIQSDKNVLSGKQSGDGLNKVKDGSELSLGGTSSKVQQLRLFWDKFFLTETEANKSSELIDKSRFLSEAKYEVLDKPRKKSMRKSAAKILEKTIPPSRVPISFRMIPSKQNKAKKRLEKEENFLDLDLMSREVSTCVSKIPGSSDDNSEDGSDYTLAESGPESVTSIRPTSVSDVFKEKLYKIFLSHQVSLPPSSSKILKSDDAKGVFLHEETGRSISCSRRKGFILTLKGDEPLHCYTEGVVVRREEATTIDPSVLIKTKKPERKPRKVSTLLPCYYFTVQDNPVDLASRGDSVCFQDPKKNTSDDDNARDEPTPKYDCRPRTTVSYEKVTITSSDTDKTHIKLVISKDEPTTKFSVLVIVTFSSVTILSFIVIVLKFFESSILFP